MNAGTKFAIGALLILGSVGYLMASGVKETGQYFLTPSVVVEGRLQTDGVIHATNLLAKCGSRYEAVPKA